MQSRSLPTGDLEQRVTALERDQNSRLQEIAWALDQKLYYITGAALLISSLAAFIGWQSYKDLDGVICEKIRVTLENELYQLDPANLTVRLPKDHPDTPLMKYERTALYKWGGSFIFGKLTWNARRYII